MKLAAVVVEKGDGEVREDVHLFGARAAEVDERRRLHRRHQRQREFFGGGGGARDAGEAVVVGEGDDVEPSLGAKSDVFLGRRASVAEEGVPVKIRGDHDLPPASWASMRAISAV